MDRKTAVSASDLTVRQLPYSPEAEQAVLGALILDGTKINEIAGKISPEDFYIDKHVGIYEAVTELFVQSRTIDAVTLVDLLVKRGLYNEAGASSYIHRLAETVPSIANIGDYVRIVRDKAMLRRLIGICSEIEESAYEQSEDARAIVDCAEAKIFELSQGNITQDFAHVRDIIMQFMANLNFTRTNKEEAKGLPTYFGGIDNFLVGMGKGDLVVVGARPGMGKTSFAMNIATSAAKHGKVAAVFSLEMSKIQLVSRMLSSEARIDSYNLRTGELNADEFARLAAASTMLSGAEIYIDDTSDITVSQMKAKLRRLKNLSFVVIDYLQLMSSDKRIDNRTLEIGDISRNLKIMAKEFGVPVMLLSQLSRNPEGRPDKKPQLSDMRDSGAIEQDADIVMFLYRDEYYKENTDMKNQASCMIAKNRHGGTGAVTLGWEGKYTRFCTIEQNFQEPHEGSGDA
ncbi:Replicative DNA helicase [bioreactor metagenome]|uniref:DNA 5'-3' helicase n=1 Tax=bioreactor metagenome TaxID=1076179 RepID=A0A644Z1F4_9ZZZZ|nr:replicative DNA helicase [Oscillospiraceae bacterium]